MNDQRWSAHYEAVCQAQLKSALSNLSISLTANSFIAASAAMMVYYENPKSSIFIWLGVIVAFNLVRLVYGRRHAGREDEAIRAEAVLRRLTVFAFVGGLAWVPLAAYFMSAINSATAAYIVFILSGIATGAIIQSLAYWRISVAFGAPILTTIMARLVLQGQAIDYVVAINLLLLMTMLFRIAILSERQFKASHFTTLEAIELAGSLKSANDEVQKANETLKKLASTDPLTGLPNRSVFNRLLSETSHTHEPICLALIDVDHFKQINDSYGHQKGDAILCSLALVMLDQSGDGVTPIRLGGDEFAMTVTGADGSRRLAAHVEALRHDFATLRQREGLPQVTLSIGVCANDDANLSATELFSEADSALYEAKSAGRDCVRFSRRLPGASRVHKTL